MAQRYLMVRSELILSLLGFLLDGVSYWIGSLFWDKRSLFSVCLCHGEEMKGLFGRWGWGYMHLWTHIGRSVVVSG